MVTVRGGLAFDRNGGAGGGLIPLTRNEIRHLLINMISNPVRASHTGCTGPDVAADNKPAPWPATTAAKPPTHMITNYGWSSQEGREGRNVGRLTHPSDVSASPRGTPCRSNYVGFPSCAAPPPPLPV